MSNSAIQSAQFGVATEAQRGVVNGTDARNLVFGGSALSFRNRIINGSMLISQRYGASKHTQAVGNVYEYGTDRWSHFTAVAGDTSLQQIALPNTDSPASEGHQYYLRTNKEVVGTSTNVAITGQPIEGYNVADLQWGTANAKNVTITFWAKASGSYNFCLTLAPTITGAAYTYVSPFNVTTSWQKYTIVVPGPGTGFPNWNKDSNCGISVRFVLGGAATTSTFNQWKADNNYTGGSTQFMGLGQNAFFDVTGVQLEAGSVATPFEHRPIGAELQLCQRYYYRTGGTGSYTLLGTGYNFSTTQATGLIPFPVTMRIAPTTIEQSATATHYRVNHGITITDCSAVPTFASGTSASVGKVDFTVASGLTAGQGSMLVTNTTGNGYLGFSAEL